MIVSWNNWLERNTSGNPSLFFLLPMFIITNIEKPLKEYLQHFFYNSLFHFVFNLNPVNLVKTGYYLRTLKD